MAPLVFFIHVVGEVMRPVTLALRLFGNIMGEETVVLSLIALVVPLAKKLILIPVQLPNMLLGLVTALVQALIFAMLAAVYLTGVLREGHEEAR
jgi:F-type H+-transporting ATPase subunit a